MTNLQRTKPFIKRITFIIMAVVAMGCSVGSAKKHYLLAEKLWTSGHYESAEKEFLKVIKNDPGSKLGHKALFRVAMTQTIFLKRHADAIENFIRFIEIEPNHPSAWSARLQIGEILYSKLRKHREAIIQYRKILRLNPEISQAAELQFRIAKSHFFLMDFQKAIDLYRVVMRDYKKSRWAEQAAFEIGISYFTGGGEETGKTDWFNHSVKAYNKFIKKYPDSKLIPQARFGIAACLEEQELLSKAYERFAELKGVYPSPNVIEIRLARIRERMKQKSQ